MIPALFLVGGLGRRGGIFVYAWKITATEDTLADYPDDHPGWPALAEAVNAERFEQHVADVFTQADIDRLRAIAAADAEGCRR